jgi:hypothetical protein
VEWQDKAYPMRFKDRELSTRSVAAAGAEIRGEHNSSAEAKGQAGRQVPATPKRSPSVVWIEAVPVAQVVHRLSLRAPCWVEFSK